MGFGGGFLVFFGWVGAVEGWWWFGRDRGRGRISWWWWSREFLAGNSSSFFFPVVFMGVDRGRGKGGGENDGFFLLECYNRINSGE